MLRLEDKPRRRLKSPLDFSIIRYWWDTWSKANSHGIAGMNFINLYWQIQAHSIELSLSLVSHRKFKFRTGLMKRDIKKPQMPTTQKGFMSHVSKNRSHNSSKKKKATACEKNRVLRVPRKLKLLGWSPQTLRTCWQVWNLFLEGHSVRIDFTWWS